MSHSKSTTVVLQRILELAHADVPRWLDSRTSPLFLVRAVLPLAYSLGLGQGHDCVAAALC